MESILQQTNWNEEWARLHEARRRPDDSAYWDKRAHSFDSDLGPSDYRTAFVERADVRPGESVFDMGCGTGSLSIEYARAGHEVLGADFSSGMLAEAQRRVDAQGVKGVDFLQMSWEDDWESCGIAPGSYDVAIASRSIATDDMSGAIAKLSAVARRHCIITLSTGGTPRTDTRALDACGIPHFDARDFQYALNILINAGYLPNLSYISSTRTDSFDSLDGAMGIYRKQIGEMTSEQVERLESWLSSELVSNEREGESDGHGGVNKRLRLAHPRIFHWAFISWDV